MVSFQLSNEPTGSVCWVKPNRNLCSSNRMANLTRHFPSLRSFQTRTEEPQHLCAKAKQAAGSRSRGGGLARPVWTRGRPSSARSSARPRRSSSGASTPRSSGPPSTPCLDPCLRFDSRLSVGILPLSSFSGWDACCTCSRCNPRAFG